jgi:ethanolamine utilization protein EutA
MAGAREMLSVGIDIGTTTTQVVFSRVQIHDVARPGQVPRLQVGAKHVLHESQIYFTPLKTPEEVDVQRLSDIVINEYRTTGLQPHDIETGAVIITGEIARTYNADTILKALSEIAGDFVVTVAGPNVEAQIAGRGSGAAAYSLERYTQVTNIDVGGGTANAAVFKLGEHLSSSGLAVGGRQVIVEKTSGMIRHIAGPGQIIVKALNLRMQEGMLADLPTLQRFCDCMAELVADLASGIVTPLGHKLQLSPPLQIQNPSPVLFVSGGVGAYFYEPIDIHSLSDVLIHEDVGPLFAQSLRQNSRLRNMNIKRPAQTTRATVMGASSQTVTLSGSTIWAEEHLLPLKNLPVIRPQLSNDDLFTPERLSASIRTAATRWDIDFGSNRFAVAIDLPEHLDYAQMHSVASGVVHYSSQNLANSTPLVLILERDYAQVLGQTIKTLRPELPLVSIDQIGLGEGDFIDIGKPIMGGRVVPLSIKTLIFYHS